VLASFVLLAERGEPSSARVDYDAATHALPQIRRALSWYHGWQDTLSESTDLCARDGSSVAWRTSTPDCDRVARRTAGTASRSTRNEPDASQTTSDRARVRTGLFFKYPLDGAICGTTLSTESPLRAASARGTHRA
jgi:hypothetical protein